MTESPTVLIVGGGATGVSLARDLALRGVDVTLIERDGLGSGTSGRSHGLLHSGARYAESDPAAAQACLDENRTLRRIAGGCLRDTGGLFVHLSDDDPGYFAEKREACETAGIETTVLDGNRACELVPDLSEAVERAIKVPDAVVRPSRLVAATAADAAAHGATIRLHAPLEDLTVEDSRITAARVGGRAAARLTPEYVVNAAGAWAGKVASIAGVTVEMAPTRGVMVSLAYPGLGPVLNRCRPPADGDIVVPHETEAVVGTTSVPVSDPDEYERADWESSRIIEECARMLPPIATAEPVRTWWGVRPLFAPAGGRDRRGISREFACLDHRADGVSNFASVVGGKLTTHRRMAERAADLVCDRLGVAAACQTASRSLPHAEDPERLDEYVARYDAGGPTDADTVTARSE